MAAAKGRHRSAEHARAKVWTWLTTPGLFRADIQPVGGRLRAVSRRQRICRKMPASCRTRRTERMTLETESAPAAQASAAPGPIWFSSYPPGVPRSIDPDRYPSLPAMLLDACTRHAAHPAFECLATRMTYADWDRLSRAFAAFLVEEAKCRPGDRLAIMLPNLLAYPVAFLGALRAGLTVVNVNPLYTPRELKEQLADSGAVAIVIMENFAHKLETVVAETSVRHVVVARLGDFMPTLKRALFNFVNAYVRRAVPVWRFETFTTLHEACRRRPGSGYADAQPAAQAPALLQYTGGTTGVPKGAVLTHRNLVANALQGRAWMSPYLPEETGSVLTPLPLYHIFSLTANLLSFALMGGLSVLVPDPRDIKGLIRTMRRARVTTMTGVNTLFNALLNRPEFAGLDFSKLGFAIGGGAAVQSAVATRWREVTGTALVEGYGLTEASPIVCINPVSDPKLGTVGLPVPSTEVAIRDDAGNDLPVGEPGEICVRGPQVMQGYWQRPEETRLVLTGEGWLHTGDIGVFDAQGFLKILDRKKDMINVSGFKVFPNEVEDVIAQHPGVLEAAVIGINDAHTGQAVKLFVVKRDPALTAADLTQFARARLAGYKVPKVIAFVDGLPKSNVGKIVRKDLR
jgi:long-chain acyl-CoA synthetase